MDNRSIVKPWLRDSAIAFLLILAGIVFGRHLAQWLHARGVGSLCCLSIAEIPFVVFLGMRRGFFRWWEYLGFFACIVSISVAQGWLVQRGSHSTLVAGVATGLIFAFFIGWHGAIQANLAVSASDRSVGGKATRS